MDDKTVLQRADSVTFEIVADEAILIDMNSGTYFSLNLVGTLFWERIDGQKNIGTIAEAIATLFSEKARQFGAKLHLLAQSGQAEVTKIGQLAVTYDMDEEMVADCLATLQADSSETQLNSLVNDLAVTAEMVVGDLLELAGTMVAEKLLLVDGESH